MNTWLLLIAMYTPGGDFIDKQVVDYEFKSKADCVAVQRSMPNLDLDAGAMGVKHRGLCITKDHWTGKRPMKDVALD